ncbi:MAG: superoxide dismutase [Candidatus Bathyarchaeia archaeon]
MSTIKKYVLPDLPYRYDALEPVISQEILRFHHDKHHAAYVNGANAALEKLEAARRSGFANFDIRAVERDLAFNLSGHLLHSLYWANMKPAGGGQPGGALADGLNTSFGSFAVFKQQLSSAAKAVEGSGWGLLAYEPDSKQLLTLQVQNHQGLAVQGAVPLMTIDVWEHAYYLQYKNDRGSYVDKWWDVVNWDDVAKRYEKAL